MLIRADYLARIIPFAFYIAVMVFSDALSALNLDVRWVYALRAGGAAALLYYFWDAYLELKSKPHLLSLDFLLSIFIGLLVFYLWINLDLPWMLLGEQNAYQPSDTQGLLNLPMVVVRIAGAALVVPILEELFWRSFVMCWVDHVNFLQHAPAQVTLRAFLMTSLVFAIEHSFWFAGFVAGALYAALYCRTQNLWYPIIAHTVTNATLGLWVVLTQQWQYW